MPICESASMNCLPRGKQARTLADMSELRFEVRVMSRRAHRIVLAGSPAGKVDHRRALRALFERWLAESNGHALVICLASAVECGIPVHKHAERCGAWVAHQGSNAVRALYWAAAHRLRAQSRAWTALPTLHSRAYSQTPKAEVITGGPAPAGLRSVQHELQPPLPQPKLCEYCAVLLSDSRCSTGHDLLLPRGHVVWRHAITGSLYHTGTYQCGTWPSLVRNRPNGHSSGCRLPSGTGTVPV